MERIWIDDLKLVIGLRGFEILGFLVSEMGNINMTGSIYMSVMSVGYS